MLLRRNVPSVTGGARVDAGEIRVAASKQDRQHPERLARGRMGLFRASRHHSASLPDMGWGLHCSGQIVRFAFGSPSSGEYQQSGRSRDCRNWRMPEVDLARQPIERYGKPLAESLLLSASRERDEVVMEEREASLEGGSLKEIEDVLLHQHYARWLEF